MYFVIEENISSSPLLKLNCVNSFNIHAKIKGIYFFHVYMSTRTVPSTVEFMLCFDV